MKMPERFRVAHPLAYKSEPGDPFGCFVIPTPYGQPGEKLSVIACAGQAKDISEGWDHVSVSLKNRCPTWDEMNLLKDLFWDAEDCVVQYHPPKSDYINNHNFCLHLWKRNGEMPRPPSILVGVK